MTTLGHAAAGAIWRRPRHLAQLQVQTLLHQALLHQVGWACYDHWQEPAFEHGEPCVSCLISLIMQLLTPEYMCML